MHGANMKNVKVIFDFTLPLSIIALFVVLRYHSMICNTMHEMLESWDACFDLFVDKGTVGKLTKVTRWL